METFNRSLFLVINAPAHAGPLALAVALAFAEYAIWLVPATLAFGWLRGDDETRFAAIEAALAGMAALLMNQLIALAWWHPRPFAIHLGHAYLAHAADSSFPSDHLTLLWAVGFSLALHRQTRAAGVALSLLGVPMAWARIYLGVHYPLDMAGAALVAALSAQAAWRGGAPLTGALYRTATRLHSRLFAGPIRRGWVRK